MMRPSLAALILALASLPATAAEPVVDPADLFPPGTLAYAEVVKPAELARGMAAFTKGTPIEDMPGYMSKWRTQQTNGYYPTREMLGMFSTFAGPEALAEIAQMQGAAVAITGVNKNMEPEIVGVILPGQSNFPGFLTRMILTVESGMRSGPQVEGVRIFGTQPQEFNRIAPGGAVPPPPPRPLEAPFLAFMPDCIVIGSSHESVADVVKRYKGKEKRPALSGDPAFKSAVAMRQRPGLFVYAHPARGLAAIHTEAMKDVLPPMSHQFISELLNPQSIRSLAMNLAPIKDALNLQLAVNFEQAPSGLLVELFSGPKTVTQVLQPVPKETLGVFAFTLTDGEKLFQRWLAAADALVGDQGPKPSDQIKQIEEALKISLGKEVLGRINAIAVAMPAKQEVPRGAEEVPMLIITAKDEAAAEKLEQLVPNLVSTLTGEKVEPVAERLDGVRVRSLPATAMPWRGPLRYGRQGATLVFGTDRKLVAASLSNKTETSLLADAIIRESFKGHENVSAIGLGRWAHFLPELLADIRNQTIWENGQRVVPDASKKREIIDKIRKTDAALLQQIPPLVISVTRQEGTLTMHFQQRHSGDTRTKVIERIFDAIVAGASNLFDQIGAVPAAPPAPPPVKN